MQKSLNQRYKESGTTLTYKEWRKREDSKMSSFDGLIPKIPPASIIDSASYAQTQKDMAALGGYQTSVSNKTLFGINKYILIFGGIIVVSAIAYKIYKTQKK